MENKAHLTIEGINKIINIKAATLAVALRAIVNLGLSELLKSEFKDFILSPLGERPRIQTEIISNPY
jgi:hypothetical protein